MNKPEYIGAADWKTLLEKHQGKLPEAVINKLENQYPVQYLIGNVEFLDLNILVNEKVLIPRFETELMVKKTLDLVNSDLVNASRIIDLGCGSGAIAISLAKKLNKTVDALDISKDALEVTNLNALQNNVKVNLINRDILKDNIKLNHTLIISNPPYVCFNEDVDPQTKYEPQNAIFAEENGLIFYKRIIELAKENRQKKFTIVFEIGCTQKDDIIKFILDTFPKAEVICETDFSNRDRYIFANVFQSE